MNTITRLLLITSVTVNFFSSCTYNNMLQIGDAAPNFCLMDQDSVLHQLSQLRGKKVVLCFYPKDNTFGCKREMCNLRDNYSILTDAGIVILGISKGTVKSKNRFANKNHLPFPLLFATDEVLRDYGAQGILFIKRYTYLIDENGIIVAILKKIDTKNHAQQILEGFNLVHN